MTNLDKPGILSTLSRAQHLLLGFFVLWALSCDTRVPEEGWSGFTMGTSYWIKLRIPPNLPDGVRGLRRDVDSLLAEMNRQMSTYLEDSEISRFNHWQSTTPFPVSEEFREVVVLSLELSQLTDGAFDITVFPLVGLWGFGPEKSESDLLTWKRPRNRDLVESRSRIGYRLLELAGDSLRKVHPKVAIDLNAIGKGYTVDRISNYLSLKGVVDHLVEIGGEVRAQGTNSRGKSWIVGIDSPDRGSLPGERLLGAARLDNRSMATSGDYRVFHTDQDSVFSHEIDPHTGRPAQTGVASATVIAPTCAWADGLSTAFMVMRPQESLDLMESLDGVEGLLVIRDQSGSLVKKMSSGFEWVGMVP